MVGVKPQTDAGLLAFCHELAAFLTGETMQLTRFEEKGWGPSNIKAKQNEAVKQNAALTALGAQQEHCVPQGQYPNAYWSLTEAFGTDINAGKYKTADDTALYAALKTLEDGVKAAG
jgi:arabinogalactan oligomer/maltooligosaccharide transport system substrate-binding protein